MTAALLALGAGQALAAPIDVTTSVGPITLVVADVLTVDAGGVVLGGNVAVAVPNGVAATSITVNPSVSGTAAGTIVGVTSGILIGDPINGNGKLTGGITNSGLIEGTGQSAIAIIGGTIAGSTVDGAINNLSTGRMVGGTVAVYVRSSTIGGGITNAGVIQGVTNAGILFGDGVSNNSLVAGTLIGDLVNTVGGTISGGTSGTAIALFSRSAIQGSIVNDGTITAPHDGVRVTDSSVTGNIINNLGGRIEATGNYSGVNLYTSTLGNSTTTGFIINDSGTISGRNDGIHIQSGSSLTGGITNSGTLGTISGVNKGIFIGNSTIDQGISNLNGGSIVGSTYAGIAISSSQITGGIRNTGTLSKISGSEYGIYIGDDGAGPSLVSGGITNSGTIQGTSSGIGIAIVNSAVTGGLTNSGTISGDFLSVRVSGTGAALDGITVTGTNTAKFIGAVVAPNTPMSVATGASYTMDNGNRFTVSGFTTDGTLGVAAGGTATVTGNYTQNSSGTFRTNVTNSTTYGKLTVSGSAGLPTAAQFDVVTGDAATCGGITAGGTLAGVLKSGVALTSTTFATVTDDCTNVNFTAVYNSGTRAIDLVASSAGPTTWIVTGASNNNSFGTVSCVSPVANNGTATCTGTASGGYTLSGAAATAGCGTSTISGNTITAGPVTAACSVTGTFASTTTYAVTATANPVAGGSVTCTPASGIASGGSSTCSGTANPGYTFTNWGGDCTSAASNATCTLANITAAKSVAANFAAASTSQTNLLTTNGVAASMSVSGCASITNAAFVAPSTGAPSNTTFPFGMLGFTLNGCISGPVAVTVTYAQPLPSGATFYKNINGTYSAYPATLGANTVTFSLTDGGAGDADGVPTPNGSIRDPGGLGVTAAAAVPQSIPTLSEWGMIFLSSLVAMFGMTQVRRRRG